MGPDEDEETLLAFRNEAGGWWYHPKFPAKISLSLYLSLSVIYK
jgi:hypothetical protein